MADGRTAAKAQICLVLGREIEIQRMFVRPNLGDAPTIACPSMCAVGAGKISDEST